MAFNNAPGIERMYPGVTKRTAFDPASASLRAKGCAG